MAFIKRQPDSIDIVILTELKRYPPSTMRRIAEVAHRSHVTIKQRYNWLEDAGYIVMADNTVKASARNKILTEKGFRYLEHCRP